MAVSAMVAVAMAHHHVVPPWVMSRSMSSVSNSTIPAGLWSRIAESELFVVILPFKEFLKRSLVCHLHCAIC